jgi:hypothetical protein
MAPGNGTVYPMKTYKEKANRKEKRMSGLLKCDFSPE